MPGFGSFAGGFAQGFFPAMHQQQELQLERQRLQQQQQRELMARADAQGAELWKNISEHAQAMLAGGDKPADVMKAMEGPITVLERLYKSTKKDPSLIRMQFGMMLSRPSSADIASAGHQQTFGQQGPQQPQPQAPSMQPAGFDQGQPAQTAQAPQAMPQQTPVDNFTQEIDNLTRAMAIAETPGLKEAYKIRLQEVVKEKLSNSAEHIDDKVLPDGTVIFVNKKNRTVIDQNGNPYVAPSKSGNGDVQRIADAIESGRQPPVTQGLYKNGAAVRAELERRGFDMSGANLEWQSAQKQIQAVNGPQMERYAGLAKSVIRTIDEVRELSKEMDLRGVVAANRVELQAYIQANGNSENGQLATRYITAVNTLKEEFANLAQGGYAPTEPVWALANQQINENYGVKQMDSAISEVQRLIRYRTQAIPNFNSLGPGSTSNRYVPQGQQPAEAARAAPASAPSATTTGGKKKGEWEIEEIK